MGRFACLLVLGPLGLLFAVGAALCWAGWAVTGLVLIALTVAVLAACG